MLITVAYYSWKRTLDKPKTEEDLEAQEENTLPGERQRKERLGTQPQLMLGRGNPIAQTQM